MNRRLTLIGLTFVAGFFIMVAIGPSYFPYKQFVASTSPAPMPFSISDLDAITLARLPDDHVLLVYADGGTIHCRESDTRGASWFEPRDLLATGLTQLGNLYASVVVASSGRLLLLAWDAEPAPGNATRRAFYAVVNMETHAVVVGPSYCSEGSGTVIETFPTIAGNSTAGYRMSWLVNASGNHAIAVRSGSMYSSWGSVVTTNLGTDIISNPIILLASDGNFELVHVRANATSQQVIHRAVLHDGSLGNATIIVNGTRAGIPVTSLDGSLASTDDLILSFLCSGTINGAAIDAAPVVVYATRASGFKDVLVEVIPGRNTVQFLQHVRFTNDQVLSIWIEPVGSGSDGSLVMLFVLTDFDMTNKNSTFHSLLLAYIFLSCGIFNIFVYFHLKQKGRIDLTSEPLNNHAVTGCFLTIGILMLLPFSGFQGEQPGGSYADGFIYPAPINLGTIITIGFVFLFYGITTPLIDRFWRRDKREQQSIIHVESKPFTWKQEILRKIPHVAVAMLILGFDPLGSNAMQFVNIQKYDRFNFVNEGGIIFDYVLRLNNIEIGSYAIKLVMAAGMIFLWILDLHVLLASPTTYYFLKDYFILAFRKKERTSMADFVVMFSSLLLMILVLTFDPRYKLVGTFVCFAGFCAICFGDTAGMIFGRLWGKHKLSRGTNKSWEGVFAGMAVSFVSALIFVELPFALIMAGIYLA
ncbi:MAG: phosphatidate cytidylyltransferase, partial [Candidatus Lokiarchaeota archaeon]|nr:phosphatidate cytidylyltransferase [Candidatus Lokiarchaeota archaeon]